MDVATPSTAKALPQAHEVDVFEGPSHDYHYWAQFIRTQFIPFMTANGRLRFTSHELMTWLENCQSLQLTTGDVEQHSSGKLVWRNTVSCALGMLKLQGLLQAPPFGKEYVIKTASLKAAEDSVTLQGIVSS